MRIVVQKFGGSLLESPEGRLQVAELITATRRRGRAIVAVVSAIGREGNPYATDTLMGLMREIGSDIDPRTLDLLLSTGEIISTAVLAHTLVRSGCPAIALTGAQAGILTSDEFNDARILSIDAARTRAHLERDQVVVVAGFQGVNADGGVTTLGRGGSDTTAVAIGAALGAEVVEIYKDVPGIMTADPKLVPGARPIQRITYDEMSQLAALGARVLDPRAADIGREHNVTLLIRRMGSPNGGTVIVKGPELGVPIIDGRPVIALAHLPDVVQLKIERRRGGVISRPLGGLAALGGHGDIIHPFNVLSVVLAITLTD